MDKIDCESIKTNNDSTDNASSSEETYKIISERDVKWFQSNSFADPTYSKLIEENRKLKRDLRIRGQYIRDKEREMHNKLIELEIEHEETTSELEKIDNEIIDAIGKIKRRHEEEFTQIYESLIDFMFFAYCRSIDECSKEFTDAIRKKIDETTTNVAKYGLTISFEKNQTSDCKDAELKVLVDYNCDSDLNDAIELLKQSKKLTR